MKEVTVLGKSSFQKKIVNDSAASTRTQRKASRFFEAVYAFVIGVLFYSTGNFGFWNIVCDRRIVQLILSIFMIIFIPFVMTNILKLVKRPLFDLACFVFLVQVFWGNYVGVMSFGIAVILTGVLLVYKSDFVDKVTKIIIVLAAVFSLMAIIQAIIIFCRPDLIYYLGVQYTSATSSDKVYVQHPLAYLGFSTFGDFVIFGTYFTRLRSFASEPSVLVTTFLIPGILALSYRGWVRWLAVPILFFTLFLVQSGTIWVCVILGAVSCCAFMIFRKFRWILAAAPFFALLIMFFVAPNMDGGVVERTYMKFVDPWYRDYSALNKNNSIAPRVTNIKNTASLLRDNFFKFSPSEKNSACGFLLSMFLQTGIVGFGISVWLLFSIFEILAKAYYRSDTVSPLSVALLYGAMMVVGFVNCYGWFSVSGLMLFAVAIRRFDFSTDKETAMVEGRVCNDCISHPGEI